MVLVFIAPRYQPSDTAQLPLWYPSDAAHRPLWPPSNSHRRRTSAALNAIRRRTSAASTPSLRNANALQGNCPKVSPTPTTGSATLPLSPPQPTSRHVLSANHRVPLNRPQKEDPNQTQITIGGNRICYPGNMGTKTASLELVKLQINDVLSTP